MKDATKFAYVGLTRKQTGRMSMCVIANHVEFFLGTNGYWWPAS